MARLQVVGIGKCGTTSAVPQGSFRRDRLRLVFIGVGQLVIAGEECRQRVAIQLGLRRRLRGGIDLRKPQRFGQPARAFEQPLGLLRHLALLEMVNELHRLLALGLTHGFVDFARA